MPGAFISGCAGTVLSCDEITFFREYDPFGFILFDRNLETPDQVRHLTRALRETVGRDAPIFVDQEGGRVQRMRAPHWSEFGPAIDETDFAARFATISAELLDVGITGNCVPLGDVARAETHAVLANRCYGSTVDEVVRNARTTAEVTIGAGLWPVLKHMPGHGRAVIDSHLNLPRVTASLEDLEASDFAAFRALADLPFAMTCHLVFDALDPERPATISPTVVTYVRDNIGFAGCLMTDDISMGALSGSVSDRSRESVAAGCDLVLHCNGNLAEMQAVAQAVGGLEGRSAVRANQALAWVTRARGTQGEPVSG